MFKFVLNPKIEFAEGPVVVRFGFEDGGLPPDDMDLCTVPTGGFWSGVTGLLDTGGGSGRISNIGRTISLFFRGCSPSVPAPSSRPDRFGSRLWRLKGLARIGRLVVLEVLGGFGRGNARE